MNLFRFLLNALVSLLGGTMLQFLVEFRFGASKEIQPISFAVFLVVAVVLFTGIEITEKIKNAVEELKKVPSKEPPASFEG